MSDSYNSRAGLDDWDQSDFVVPRVSIIQPTSSKHSEGAGEFYDESDKIRLGKSLDVVLLKVTKSRALFWPMDSERKGVQCRSADAKFPDADITSPCATECKGCKNEQKDLQFDLLFLDTKRSKEFGQPVVFMLRAKGASLRPTRAYITGIIQRNKHIFDFGVTLKLMKNPPGTKGSYFFLQYEGVTSLQSSDTEMHTMAEEAFALYADTDAVIEDAEQAQAEVDPNEIPF